MTTQLTQEVCEQAFHDYAEPLLSYGAPLSVICNRHVIDRYNSSRIYIIASQSLMRNTTALEELQTALGDKVAKVHIGLSQHTLMSECLAVMADIRNVQADLIITLGGGSIIDAAKIMAYALSNSVTDKSHLLSLPHAMGSKLGLGGNTMPPAIPIIAVTTSLSGAEYIPFAGVTDDEDGIKYQFTGNCKGPSLIVISDELSITVPVKPWLAAGVRAIDHCVEALCTLLRPAKGWEEAEEAAIMGLQCIAPSLLKTKKDPSDAKARRTAQLGVRYSMVPLKNRVFKGASHAIGHFLGPMGVGHGETSCVLMTATHKYNSKVNAKEQSVVCNVLWDIPEVCSVFRARGLDKASADLGDLLDAVVRELGLPRSLTEVGIHSHEGLELLAKNTLKDPYAKTNPIPLKTPEQVMEILIACI